MNRFQCIPVMPATMPLAWRNPSMNRAATMILPPWCSKNCSVLSSRAGVRKTYLPYLRASARPPKWPIRKPMLSPMIAQIKAMTPTATTLSRPAPAYSAAAMRMVSPGTGMPKSSTSTRTATARYP
jgi:hypothetical protein